MTSFRNMLLALLSVLAFITISVSTSDHDVGGTDVVPQMEPCGPPDTGCGSCGSGYSGCGESSCFNPSIGEVCCDGNCKSTRHLLSSPLEIASLHIESETDNA